MDKPSFSIITPSYNAIAYIRNCVASVADQQGLALEHIVQDGGSSDGTAEYILAEPRITAESKRDKGMYDAINQGWHKCTGDFVVHLNADEQLLPGALLAVAECFAAHPECSLVLGGTLICHADGMLDCFRMSIKPPLSILLTSHHPVPSCAVFLRRSAFADRPWLYDPNFRLISDVLLMIDCIKERRPIRILNRFTSAFFLTGTNIGLAQSETAQAEYRHQMSLAPAWMRLAKPILRAAFLLRRALAGHYSRKPISYDVYVNGLDRRMHFDVDRPSGVYRPAQTKEASS